MKQSPIDLIIEGFGGSKKTAMEELGLCQSAISQWIKRGNKIPPRMHRIILKAAEKKKYKLTAEELWEGR